MSNDKIAHGSIVFAKITDATGREFGIRLGDIKSKLVTPVPQSLSNTKRSATSVLSSHSSAVAKESDKIPTMEDWVIARLKANPHDVKIAREAVTKFVELSRTIVKTLKSGLKGSLKGANKLKEENMSEIQSEVKGLLMLSGDIENQFNNAEPIPSNLIKEAGMDDQVAYFLGVVLGNYIDSEVFEPTILEVIINTTKDKTPEVRAADVERQRRKLQADAR